MNPFKQRTFFEWRQRTEAEGEVRDSSMRRTHVPSLALKKEGPHDKKCRRS